MNDQPTRNGALLSFQSPIPHRLHFAMASSGCNWVVWIVLLFSFASGELLNKEPFKDINNTHFDYVILGGGTAGLVIASRPSEDPRITVAVIEAGDFERNTPNMTNTTRLGLAKNTRLDWRYESAPQIFAGNRSLIWSAGKGVGLSSLINGKSFYN